MTGRTKRLCLAGIVSLGIALILGSAAARRPVAPVVGLSDAELKNYSGTGPCSIRGQAFLKTRGGDVKYGAGEAVTLLPNISLLNEIVRINSTPGQYAVLPADVQGRWQQLRRQTQADGQGNFEFIGIPCGSWYVESQVTWEVVESAYSTSTQGGTVSKVVTVTPQSSSERVMLTY